jgi:hypothetical protein
VNLSAKLYLKQVACERADTHAPVAELEHFGLLVPKLEDTMAKITKLPGVSIAKAPFMSGARRCVSSWAPKEFLSK